MWLGLRDVGVVHFPSLPCRVLVYLGGLVDEVWHRRRTCRPSLPRFGAVGSCRAPRGSLSFRRGWILSQIPSLGAARPPVPPAPPRPPCPPPHPAPPPGPPPAPPPPPGLCLNSCWCLSWNRARTPGLHPSSMPPSPPNLSFRPHGDLPTQRGCLDPGDAWIPQGSPSNLGSRRIALKPWIPDGPPRSLMAH